MGVNSFIAGMARARASRCEWSRACQRKHSELRAANALESQMNALFREDLAHTSALSAHQKYHDASAPPRAASPVPSGAAERSCRPGGPPRRFHFQ